MFYNNNSFLKSHNDYIIYVKFKKPKRGLATENSLFLDLKILFDGNIRDKKNAYLKGFVDSLNTLDSNLKSILENSDLTLEEKQIKLEKLSEKNQSFKLALDYQVPQNLTKKINIIDQHLLELKKLKSQDISYYLPSVLYENIKGEKALKKSYKTKAYKEFIPIWKDILQVFKYLDNSFGLFLVYNLVIFLRADFNNSKLKQQIEDNQPLKRKFFFNTNERNSSDKETIIELNIKRVELTHHFGKNLLEFFEHSKNAYLYQIRKTYNLRGTNLNNDQDTKIPEEILTFYNHLSNTYNDKNMSEFKISKIGQLGMFCIYILELVDLVIEDGVFTEKGKTPSKIRMSSKYSDEIFSIPSKPKNLPMVVKPSFWQYDKNNKIGNLHYGGYRFNKELNYPSILNYHSKGITKITENNLESINYIQSNFYSINKEFLRYVKLHFKKIVKLFLRKIPDVDFLIANLNDSHPDSIIIQPLTKLFATDEVLNSLLEKAAKKSLNKSLKFQISSRQAYLTNHYFNLTNLFFGLVHSIILATRYQNFDFYFTIFMDTRGRMYYVSSGSAFGLQTGDFSHCLINLKGNNFLTLLKIKENAYSELNPNVIDYIKSLKEDKSPFSFLCAKNKISLTTISNDASCSGTSILSGLLGITYGLVKTNVFINKNSNLSEKQCIYRYFLEYLRENYPENATSIYSANEIRQKLEQFKDLTEEEFLEKVNYLLIFVKNELLQRDHVKQFVMRKNFGETNKGRLDYIYSNILLPKSYELNENFDSYRNKEMFLKSFCYYLAKWVNNLYGLAFPEIEMFCTVLLDHFSEHSLITLSSPSQSDFSYQQLKYEIKKLDRPSFTRRPKELSFRQRSNKIDLAKIQRSLVANFIHYLDSRLKFMVFQKCYITQIPVWGNHDCFYVSPTDKEILLKIYFESFKELFLSKDVIEHFLKSNNINPNEEFKSMLKTYKENRKLILSKLENGEYVISPFILTS